jgi:cytoplasmic iron level regulating protein YaaA (DUF328/UPF0246 family)
MICILSPAKSLDFDNKAPIKKHSQSSFLNDSQKIVDKLADYSPSEISELMNISADLGLLNANRYQNWSLPFNMNNAKQAIYAFTGDVYKGLDAISLTDDSISYAQSNLKLLSGLYGVIKPLDLIQAYRLEMGTKISIGDKRTLYDFWSNIITTELNKELRATNSSILLNLASNEYSKSIVFKNLNAEVISPVFKDWKNGKFKIISFYAKRARGLMARFFLENQISNVKDLKVFQSDGYIYNEEMSSANTPVFTRNTQ